MISRDIFDRNQLLEKLLDVVHHSMRELSICILVYHQVSLLQIHLSRRFHALPSGVLQGITDGCRNCVLLATLTNTNKRASSLIAVTSLHRYETIVDYTSIMACALERVIMYFKINYELRSNSLCLTVIIYFQINYDLRSNRALC